MTAFRIAACIVMGVAGSVFTSAQATSCGDSCLQGYANRYLAALGSGNPAQLPLFKTVRFTENGHTLTLSEGLWKAHVKPGDSREYFTDAHAGNAVVIATLDEDGAPAIVAARLHVSGGKISELETIVARKGSHPLFAPESVMADPLFSATVDPARRSTHERLLAIANSYFDGIEQNSSANIAATPECDRFENGVKTTHRGPDSGGCAQSADHLNYIKGVKNRRCVIVDERIGVVVCTVLFDIPGGSPAPAAPASDVTTPAVSAALRQPRVLLLSEVFKIEDGRIQRIQATMNNLPYGGTSGWN
jgi:hypothetical protein